MRTIGLFLLLWISGMIGLKANPLQAADSLVLKDFWSYARVRNLAHLPVHERIPLIGIFFLERPYRAGTLEGKLQEELIVNLRELDCVTFVENTLALAFLDVYEESAIPLFIDNLRKIRYRDGKIDGYASRLHYSGDWLYEMQRQGYLKDITRECGGIDYPLNIFFMTKNYFRYPAFLRDSLLIPQMKQIEESICKRTYFYIPKNTIEEIQDNIQSGDIILITTGIKGLDTSHVGIAVKKGDKVYLLHASSSMGKVILSKLPLSAYMKKIPSQTGIMIGRVL
ncbi:N-acetylmuramoyl-L-alanine amidase-like domain-containing protein [uncultured Odoribacter sp.]|uniref:N-acetylmuramoyl-L-alanine amidase-like domain-containing protein n=1 Tax=uncultured Odoribacter sp. TaxID=876416 RepID=UPI00261AB465|nr:N-acetylmuramoyl-L-alanine amidase-like domain-containing protein [uncultured Odoribacter sp.]